MVGNDSRTFDKIFYFFGGESPGGQSVFASDGDRWLQVANVLRVVFVHERYLMSVFVYAIEDADKYMTDQPKRMFLTKRNLAPDFTVSYEGVRYRGQVEWTSIQTWRDEETSLPRFFV